MAKKKTKRKASCKARKKAKNKGAAPNRKKRRAYPGPRKGPDSEFYHFTLVDKKNFSEFRVLERPQFGHIYAPDYRHALDRFEKKFGTRTLPKGTEIVVGKRKASAPKSKWILGKKGKPRAWCIHKVMVPLSSPVIRRLSRNPEATPKRKGVLSRLYDALWGTVPEVAEPQMIPQVVALVYELFEGYEIDPATQKQEPVSRFLIYLSQSTGKSPQEAAMNMKWQLQSQWDQRRADDFGLISLTIIWFDAAKKQYDFDMVYGTAPPQDILSRLIGMMTVPPTPGAPPGPAGPEIRVRRPPPAPRGSPSTVEELPEVQVKPTSPPPPTPTTAAPGAGPGAPPGMGIPGMPPPATGAPTMGAPRPTPPPRPGAAAPPPTGAPGAIPTPTFPIGGGDPWLQQEWEKLHRRNPFLQMRFSDNPDYHVTGKFGRLGDLDFMVHEQLPGPRPAAAPTGVRPALPAPASPAKKRPVSVPDLPGAPPPAAGPVPPPPSVGVTPPEQVVAQAKAFVDEMQSWHSQQQAKLRGRAANPRKKKASKKKKTTKKKATKRKATKKKATKKKPAKRKAPTQPRKKSAKKKSAKRKPAWKTKMLKYIEKESARMSGLETAVAGYLMGVQVTDPHYIVEMKVDRGNAYARLNKKKRFNKIASLTLLRTWLLGLRRGAKLSGKKELEDFSKTLKKKIKGVQIGMF